MCSHGGGSAGRVAAIEGEHLSWARRFARGLGDAASTRRGPQAPRPTSAVAAPVRASRRSPPPAQHVASRPGGAPISPGANVKSSLKSSEREGRGHSGKTPARARNRFRSAVRSRVSRSARPRGAGSKRWALRRNWDDAELRKARARRVKERALVEPLLACSLRAPCAKGRKEYLHPIFAALAGGGTPPKARRQTLRAQASVRVKRRGTGAAAPCFAPAQVRSARSRQRPRVCQEWTEVHLMLHGKVRRRYRRTPPGPDNRLCGRAFTGRLPGGQNRGGLLPPGQVRVRNRHHPATAVAR